MGVTVQSQGPGGKIVVSPPPPSLSSTFPVSFSPDLDFQHLLHLLGRFRRVLIATRGACFSTALRRPGTSLDAATS